MSYWFIATPRNIVSLREVTRESALSTENTFETRSVSRTLFVSPVNALWDLIHANRLLMAHRERFIKRGIYHVSTTNRSILIGFPIGYYHLLCEKRKKKRSNMFVNTIDLESYVICIYFDAIRRWKHFADDALNDCFCTMTDIIIKVKYVQL